MWAHSTVTNCEFRSIILADVGKHLDQFIKPWRPYQHSSKGEKTQTLNTQGQSCDFFVSLGMLSVKGVRLSNTLCRSYAFELRNLSSVPWSLSNTPSTP